MTRGRRKSGIKYVSCSSSQAREEGGLDPCGGSTDYLEKGADVLKVEPS